jgi:hypothetical protein
MKFPKNNKELEEIFKNAQIPEASEFDGEYFVDMLTVLPSLRKLSHRKVFHIENGKALGYNKLFSNRSWGRFFLEEEACKELGSLPAILINYDRPENSLLTNGMRDYVRRIEKGRIYIGRFNYLFMGKLLFLGYFSLIKAGT